MRRFVLAALAVVLSVGGALGWMAIWPEAAPEMTRVADVSCWGDWCSGQDPDATGCSEDGRIVASNEIEQRAFDFANFAFGGGYVGEVELMWSERCQSNWARLNLVDMAETWKITAVQDGGYRQSAEVPHPTFDLADPGIYNSPMIYSPKRAVYAMMSGGLMLLPRTVRTKWV